MQKYAGPGTVNESRGVTVGERIIDSDKYIAVRFRREWWDVIVTQVSLAVDLPLMIGHELCASQLRGPDSGCNQMWERVTHVAGSQRQSQVMSKSVIHARSSYPARSPLAPPAPAFLLSTVLTTKSSLPICLPDLPIRCRILFILSSLKRVNDSMTQLWI